MCQAKIRLISGTLRLILFSGGDGAVGQHNLIAERSMGTAADLKNYQINKLLNELKFKVLGETKYRQFYVLTAH